MDDSTTLIFVYNADSGSWNALMDTVHKFVSPDTYECNLCKLTYGSVGMKKEWEEYIKKLPYPTEFLHREEFVERYGMKDVGLPALFVKTGDELKVLVSDSEMNSAKSIEDLKEMISDKVAGNQ